MRTAAGTTVLAGLLLAVPCQAAAQQEYEIDAPPVVLSGVPFDVTVQGTDGPLEGATAELAIRVGGTSFAGELQEDGSVVVADVVAPRRGPVTLEVQRGGVAVARASTRAVPGFVSIVPPLLAIVVALVFRNVIPALFLGLWVGAWAINGFSLYGAFTATLDSFQVYVLGALTNPGQAPIILFSFMIGGMVGIISKNGGMQGVVDRIVPWANNPVRGQVATGALGLIIFFDDYANTLVVGNTMRKVTDRLKISREKLAYIVDSTAAPVSCVAFVTTWIGYEVGLIDAAVRQIPGFNEAAYSVFLSSIPYSFYPLLAMFFVFVVAYTHRDFGPMYHAEIRARTTGKVLRDGASVDAAATESSEMEPKEDGAHRAINAMIPVATLVASVLAGLYVTGEGDSLRDIIGSSDANKALMWGSLLGVLVAAALSLTQRILTLQETVDAWYAGLRSMMFAMIILILAWSLSSITQILQTAAYLVSVLGDALLPGVIPALVFILSAATAFATGSSWGTMGILMPLVLPLTWAVLTANAMGDQAHYHVIYSTVACVLGGAVWGDHCSPISDTTILSSMASGSDHIDHVRTQLPYAFLVGLAAVGAGTLPVGFGFPWWLGLLMGAAVVFSYNRFLGKPVDEVSIDSSHAATGG